MSRRIRAALVGATVLWLVAAFPLAARADEVCAPPDVVCIEDPLAGPPQDPAGVLVDDAVDSAGEAIDPVRDEADPVVGPIVEVMDDLLGGTDIVDPPGGGGGEQPSDGGPGGPGAGTGDDRRPGALRDPLTFARESGAPTTLEISADSGIRPTGDGPRHGFGGLVEEAITGAVLLLVLFGVTVGFVLLQNRIDHADPKLAIAPVRTDVMRFE